MAVLYAKVTVGNTLSRNSSCLLFGGTPILHTFLFKNGVALAVCHITAFPVRMNACIDFFHFADFLLDLE